MPDCSYCTETFDSETAYLKHLSAEHRGELSRLDERRVEDAEIDVAGGVSAWFQDFGGMAIIAAIVIVSVGFSLGVLVTSGANVSMDEMHEPSPSQTYHEHGTIEMIVDGEEVDFSQSEYVGLDSSFHFHEGYHDQYGEHVWHVHAETVTLEYALHTLDIDVSPQGDRITYGGETYDDSDPGTTVNITVDGEPVTPRTYVLDGVGPEDEAAAGEGDDVRIVVESE